jgi:hypothetical protein
VRITRRVQGRVVLAFLVMITSANLAVTWTAFHAEGHAHMNSEDTLSSRLPQMINDSATVQAAAGKGATASVNGNDAIGQVNITTGASPGTGSLVHVTFRNPYKVQPFVFVTPEDQPPPASWYVTIDWNGFDIWVSTPPEAHANYPFDYFVAARPWSMYLGPDGTPVDADGSPAPY